MSTRHVVAPVSYREPALSSAAQAGMVNNLNDGLAWGLFPLLFATAGPTLNQIGALAALSTPPSGASANSPPARCLTATAANPSSWPACCYRPPPSLGSPPPTRSSPGPSPPYFLGAGTAMVYPTLLAAIGDVAHPAWRARAVGVYRPWRDSGFAIGALLAGILADAYGIHTATAALTAAGEADDKRVGSTAP